MDSDRPRRRETPNAQAARLFGVSPSMKKKRVMVLAMAIAVLAISSQAMTACKAKDAATQHATTAQERTTNRGAATASFTDSPEVVTTLRAWGNNYSGQLGDETYGNNRTTPVKVSDLHRAEVKAIAAGQGHTLALKSDGTVVAWGYNRDGELGNGTNEDSPTPVRVKDFHDLSGNLSGVQAIAAGSSHSLALKEDGTVWAWGYNFDGQLGDGTKANSTRPVRVGQLGRVQAIAAGAFFSLALKEDGTVWAWGANTSGQDNKVSGQLGDDAITSSKVPVEVGDLGGTEAIAAGSSHALALKEDGTVWAWGDNFFGELGDGTHGAKADSPKPVRVSDLKGVGAIEGGGWFSLALKTDGSVWAWGYNQDGELGNGSSSDAKETKCENTSEPGDAQVRSSCTNSPTPVEVSELDGVQAIAAGSAHGLALKEDGTVWAWGANDQGQLGNGTKTLGDNTLGTNTPVQVKYLGGAKLIAAGLDFSLAGSK
jgi:alpha-tubulin suppressor-like RCC1 family protein